MELYHVLNRGVDKRDIFLDNRDRARFVHDLYEFNSHNPAGNAYRRFPMMDVGRPSWEPTHRSPNRLVDIHGWVLMKNHYHLLLSECVEKGLSRFIQKLNGGYAKYFNERNKRQGALFQGKTKRIMIDSDGHFLHILHYIHLNPLDFTAAKDWRARRIHGSAEALEYLQKYRWSSFSDYCGRKNFPSILQKELFSDVFQNYERTIMQYLREIDADQISEYTLE
jgi:putative transposase